MRTGPRGEKPLDETSKKKGKYKPLKTKEGEGKKGMRKRVGQNTSRP